MKQTERVMANIWIQASTVLMLSLYLYQTYETYPTNVLLYAIAILLGILGFFKQLPVAVLASLAIVLIYGSLIVYPLYIGQLNYEPTLNDLVWLIILPFTALVGGIHREDRLPKLSGLTNSYHDYLLEEQLGAMIAPQSVLDENLQFQSLSTTEFFTTLQECINAGERTKSSFSLLLIQIHRLRLFEHKYGDEQTRYLLNRTASLINKVMPDTLLKVYLQQGLYAVVLSGQQPLTPHMARLRLDNRFGAMLLSRARNDGMVQVSLIYGSSEFPLHGDDAESLFQQALHVLDSTLKDVEL